MTTFKINFDEETSTLKIGFNPEKPATNVELVKDAEAEINAASGVAADKMARVYTALYKNGSQVQLINLNLAGTDGRVLYAAGNYALSLSASDYIEVYVNAASSSTNTISVAGSSNETSYFGGYKVLGA